MNRSFDSPAENLACDEALLDFFEEREAGETLRFWESKTVFVVAGYSNRVAAEIDLDACGRAGVPVFRRCSGGGTVVQGPGCLNYSLILRIEEDGASGTVAGANEFIMQTQREALQTLHAGEIKVEGCTDLTVGGIKFSGNAQRRRRRFLLFHGSILLNFDLAQIETLLRMPSRQPTYRLGRPHREFVENFPASPDEVKRAIRSRWGASEALTNFPRERVERLVHQRYGRDEWNFKF